jgi:hypothetical protein
VRKPVRKRVSRPPGVCSGDSSAGRCGPVKARRWFVWAGIRGLLVQAALVCSVVLVVSCEGPQGAENVQEEGAQGAKEAAEARQDAGQSADSSSSTAEAADQTYYETYYSGVFDPSLSFSRGKGWSTWIAYV